MVVASSWAGAIDGPRRVVDDNLRCPARPTPRRRASIGRQRRALNALHCRCAAEERVHSGFRGDPQCSAFRTLGLAARLMPFVFSAPVGLIDLGEARQLLPTTGRATIARLKLEAS